MKLLPALEYVFNEVRNMKYVKVFRCRLCRLLYNGRGLHRGTEASLAAAQYQLSEHSYEGAEHDEHLCKDGSVGIADLAGYQLDPDSCTGRHL